MSFYLEIISTTRPFPFNVDDNNRVMFSANFTAEARSVVDDWELEIARLVTDAGLGTFNTDVFAGPLSVIPKGDGPYISISDTGGAGQTDTHNNDIYEKLSAQVVVRGINYTTTRAKALAVWRVLHGVRNTTVVA